MSRSFLRGVLAACIAAAVIVAIQVVPKWWARRAAQEAVQPVVDQAIHDAVRQVANDAARGAARRAAEEVAAAATRPAPTTVPVVLDRTAYRITLPPGSAINPADRDLGPDRMATVDLPGRGTLIVVVADDKARAGPEFDKMVAALRPKLDNPTTAQPRALDPAKVTRSTAIAGTANGEPFVYELAEQDGRTRACLIILEYPQPAQAATVALMRPAMATLQVKD